MGSRTTKERNARGDGINVFSVNALTGEWVPRQLVGDLVNPSFLALYKDVVDEFATGFVAAQTAYVKNGHNVCTWPYSGSTGGPLGRSISLSSRQCRPSRSTRPPTTTRVRNSARLI